MTRSNFAAGDPAAGTDGTSDGSSTPTTLTTTVAAATAAERAITFGIERGSTSARTPERASTAAPTGSVAAPVSAMTPFGPTSDAGRDEAVDGEQRSHDREAAADHDGAAVARADACGGEHDRSDGGDEGADADAVEVHGERRHEHAVACPEDERSRRQRAGNEHGPDA